MLCKEVNEDTSEGMHNMRSHRPLCNAMCDLDLDKSYKDFTIYLTLILGFLLGRNLRVSMDGRV